MNKLALLVLAGLVPLVPLIALSADDQEIKHSPQAEELARQKREAITAELKTGQPEWAGEYYEGDGTGVNVTLILAPKSGYVFEWHGCMGLYDRNYGAVTTTNGQLMFSFTYPNSREGFQGIADCFIPVRWGERAYLVPVKEVDEFCNQVNSGAEPRNERHGQVLLRIGDEQKKVFGQPVVPAAIRNHLLPHPLKAVIVKTGPPIPGREHTETTVTLNLGTKDGVWPGMEFYVTGRDRSVISFPVTSATETESKGIILQSRDEESTPQTGWTLSTRAPWHRTTE